MTLKITLPFHHLPGSLIISYDKKHGSSTYPCVIELMIGTEIAGRAKLSQIYESDEIYIKKIAELNLKKTMNLSHIYVDKKYQGQKLSWILLSNIIKIAQIRFAAEWIVLERMPLYKPDEDWLKLYYEKVGFVDIGFKNLMYANINQILANHRFKNMLLDHDNQQTL